MSYNPDEYYNTKGFKDLLCRFEEAEKNGQRIILDPEEYTDIAEYYYNRSNAEYAKEIIDYAISIYPGATEPMLFKAKLALWEDDDTIKAEECAEQIEDKTDPEYYYIKAEILLTDGMNEEADAYLEECCEGIDEDDRDFFMIDVADIFADYDDMERAEAWLNKSEVVDSVEYKEQLARIMIGKGMYGESEKLLNELIDKDPYAARYWNSLASSQFSNNDIEGGIRSCEYSIAINPNDKTALFNMANGLYNLGNYTEALKYYRKYNELCPNDENGELLVGFCHLLLEDYDNAIACFEKIEERMNLDPPNAVELYKNWAWALFRQDRIDEGLKTLDKTKRLPCDHNEMLIFRGSLLIGSDRYREAKDCFLKAARDAGYTSEVFTKIAIVIYDCGFDDIAYRMFRLIYSHNSGWTKGYAHYAACCYGQKKTEEFVDALEKAIRYSPNLTKEVFKAVFPDDPMPQRYYDYMLKKMSQSPNN